MNWCAEGLCRQSSSSLLQELLPGKMPASWRVSLTGSVIQYAVVHGLLSRAMHHHSLTFSS